MAAFFYEFIVVFIALFLFVADFGYSQGHAHSGETPAPERAVAEPSPEREKKSESEEQLKLLTRALSDFSTSPDAESGNDESFSKLLDVFKSLELSAKDLGTQLDELVAAKDLGSDVQAQAKVLRSLIGSLEDKPEALRAFERLISNQGASSGQSLTEEDIKALTDAFMDQHGLALADYRESKQKEEDYQGLAASLRLTGRAINSILARRESRSPAVEPIGDAHLSQALSGKGRESLGLLVRGADGKIDTSNLKVADQAALYDEIKSLSHYSPELAAGGAVDEVLTSLKPGAEAHQEVSGLVARGIERLRNFVFGDDTKSAASGTADAPETSATPSTDLDPIADQLSDSGQKLYARVRQEKPGEFDVSDLSFQEQFDLHKELESVSLPPSTVSAVVGDLKAELEPAATAQASANQWIASGVNSLSAAMNSWLNPLPEPARPDAEIFERVAIVPIAPARQPARQPQPLSVETPVERRRTLESPYKPVVAEPVTEQELIAPTRLLDLSAPKPNLARPSLSTTLSRAPVTEVPEKVPLFVQSSSGEYLPAEEKDGKVYVDIVRSYRDWDNTPVTESLRVVRSYAESEFSTPPQKFENSIYFEIKGEPYLLIEGADGQRSYVHSRFTNGASISASAPPAGDVRSIPVSVTRQYGIFRP
ncbi:MAG: hypothetical protein H6617_06330 [Bdellovibrionaceae bacterium]|nr:hypothetical protein [Pseudobdellovibrionaceae bacterium]